MNIYLAARYSRREELLPHKDALEASGHVVTSRWLLGNHQAENDQLQTGAAAEQFASEDLADLAAADLLIAFTEQPRSTSSRGGRHVEYGYALGRETPIIVVGPRENVFCCLPQVHVVDTFDEAAWIIAGLTEVAA